MEDLPADVLVTGATGLLGSHVVRQLEGARGPDGHPARIVATWHHAPPPSNLRAAWEAIDLADADRIAPLLERVRPRVVLHAAVSTRPEDYTLGIVAASAALARASRAVGARFVHVSSDMVFDGEHGPFAEDAPLSPITPYGRAKAEAESAVRAADPSAMIVRSSLLYRLDPPDRALAAWLDGLAHGTAYPLFADEIRCPAPVDDVARALVSLAHALGAGKDTLPHTLHVVGPAAIDRYAFGTAILRALGMDPGLARRAELAHSGLVRPRALVLTREKTPAWLVEGIRPPAVALSAPRTRPAAP